MKKKIFILTLVLHSMVAQAQQDTLAARHWLQTALHRYFAGSLTLRQIATQRYAAFKTDAMNVGMNGGMSQAAFERKWKHSYTIRQAGLYEGFLIPLQDWTRVSVTCSPLSTDSPGLWIAAGITEEPSGEYFRRNIKLVYQKNSWLIDDVQAIPPLHECITGDFDGDKKQDTLYATLTSGIDGRPILVDTLLQYDSLIAITIRQKPLLQLTGNHFPPLLLNENDYVLGLYHLAGINNIDTCAGDEIGLIINAADWSNSNLYKIYSYCNGYWSLLKAIEIKEEHLTGIRSGKLKPYSQSINKH